MQSNKLGKAPNLKPPVKSWAGLMKTPKTSIPTRVILHEVSAILRSLDSAVSSLLALISKEYAQIYVNICNKMSDATFQVDSLVLIVDMKM